MNIDELRRAFRTRDNLIRDGWSHNDAVAYARNAHGITSYQQAARRADATKRTTHQRLGALVERHYARHPELAADVDVARRASSDWWRDAAMWEYHVDEDDVQRPTEDAVFADLRRRCGGKASRHGAKRHALAGELETIAASDADELEWIDRITHGVDVPLRDVHARRLGVRSVYMVWHAAKGRYIFVDEDDNVVEVG